MNRDELGVDPWYQFMPAMAEEEFEQLKASIAKHGFLPGHEVVILEDGRILDGHHRAKACAELGIECPYRVAEVAEDARWDYVYIANVSRRHLTAAQRRELIAEYAKRHPEASNREIAAVSGGSRTLVASVREEIGAPSHHVSGRTYSVVGVAQKATTTNELPPVAATDDGVAAPADTENLAYDAWVSIITAATQIAAFTPDELWDAVGDDVIHLETLWNEAGNRVREMFNRSRKAAWQRRRTA